jgi:hypothetical protein
MSTPKDTETDTQKRDAKGKNWGNNILGIIFVVMVAYVTKDSNALQFAQFQTILLSMVTWRVLNPPE